MNVSKESMAAKLAAELGIDVSKLSGNGRVMKADVLAVAGEIGAVEPAPAAAPTPVQGSNDLPPVKVSPLRRSIAANMEKKLTMPKLRPEMEKGVLCAWLKEEGDVVTTGEALFEIETDKVVNQIEATESGILKKQLCEEGDTVDVESPVAILETE